MASRLTQFPKHSEFLEAVNSEDPLSMIVRTHRCLDAALAIAIGERLVEPHALEVSKINFALKVDLALALGAQPMDLRAAMLSVNKLRNAVAHKHGFEFEETQARDLFNQLPQKAKDFLGKSFEEYGHYVNLFRDVAGILYTSAEAGITKIRDERVVQEFMMDEVNRVVSQDPKHVAAREELGKPRREALRRAIEGARKKRNEQGEP